MTAIESFDETLTPPPSDDRSTSSKTNPTPRSKIPSTESNSSVRKSRVPNILAPALRKRHSTYVLSSPPDLPETAVPNIPPQRPLRNPARGPGIVSTKPKTRSRPSTATGTREEVTPWEFTPGPMVDEGPISVAPVASGSSGGSSPLSTRTRSSFITGTVEEVTPWELYPVQTKTTRSSLSTGLVEEVTPWELYPIPTLPTSRSSLATGLVEEVTPWELYPIPKYDEPPNSAPIGSKYSRLSPRMSTSSSQGKTLSDLAQIRRPKSTGAKAMKARSNTLPTSSTLGQANAAKPTHVVASSNRTTLLGVSASKSAPTTPKISHKAAVPPLAQPLSSLPPSAVHPQSDLKFSTVDRTILEELKRNIRARAAQFTLKGTGTTIGSVGSCRGKKHHPYSSEEVPYPRSFERDVLDLDVWETAFCQDICESLTWHVFETPPSKVLDLGCGTGTWILDCARTWKDCRFVGLDVVPLHPDLQQVGSPDLASRITWVQANFLEGLPFPNEEFDYVHVKRIALGVPEDKWDLLLEEISRVMKPGGAFEMLEEDLFFPGKTFDDDRNSDLDSDSELITRRSSHQDPPVPETNESEGDQSSTLVASSGPSEESGEGPRMTPTPSRSHSPTAGVSPTEEEVSDEARELLAQVYGDYSATLPSKAEGYIAPSAPQPPKRPLLHITTPVNHPPHPSPQSQTSGSAFSLLISSVTGVTPVDSPVHSVVETKLNVRPRGYSLTASPLSKSENGHVSQTNLPAPQLNENVPDTPPSPAVKSPHFLLRTIPKPPINPRDHSLLETIYTQMLGARFINISPLALLANSLGLYFKDVRTHPPLQYAFPPVPTKPVSHRSTRRASLSETDNASDSDDARDAILPSPLPRSATKDRSSRRFSTQSVDSEEMTSISEDNRYLNIRGLIHHSSPYITLDESRIAALSPSTRMSFPRNTGRKPKRGLRLPNTTMNLDQRSLNLHLALRVAEILACSESMWEWVSDYQVANRPRKSSSSGIRPSRSGSVDLPQWSATSISSRASTDSVRNAILDLTREDFEGLLSKFNLDMRDNFALGSALGDRFGWSVMPSSPPPDRKIFENACEKWDKWEHEQRHNAPSHPYRSQNRHRLSKSHTTVNSSQGLSALDSREYSGKKGTQDSRSKRASVSSGPAALLPTRRMSRAMRVFVAWKA